MTIEYELRTVLSEDEIEEVRLSLINLHARKIHDEARIERWILKTRDSSLEKANNQWLRIRSNPDGDEMTLKSDAAPGESTEVSVKVSDASSAVELLNRAGLPTERHQLTLREKWSLDEVVVTFDTWPLLGTIVEVESTLSLTRVHDVISELGVPVDRFSDKGVVQLYDDVVGVDVLAISNLDFHTSVR
ncbi:MAG: CYTH domain-containing protein [Microbacterium enclense]